MIAAPIVELRNITVAYNQGTPNEVVALSKISFSVSRGETVMINGGNGSGKSTLLKAIAGTAPLSEGKVFLCGKEVTNWSPSRRAAYLSLVFQDPMLGTCPSLSVFENLSLAAHNSWWMPTLVALNIAPQQEQWIQQTGLPLLAKAANSVNVLSGGQRQALSVILAYSKARPVVLLDEFASALDDFVEQHVVAFVAAMSRKDNLTTLAVTHADRSLAKYATRRIVLDKGRLADDQSNTH